MHRKTPAMVREAADGDFAAIGRLFHETIRAVNLGDYTPEQVAAWSPSVRSADPWRRRLAGQVVLVAEESARLVGFISIEQDGHIDCLYVHKDRQRQGIATALLGQALEQARRWNLARVFTESSITARAFFEQQGFVVVHPEDVVRSGVTLCRYRMQRGL